MIAGLHQPRERLFVDCTEVFRQAAGFKPPANAAGGIFS
jgi:hypothetical protein